MDSTTVVIITISIVLLCFREVVYSFPLMKFSRISPYQCSPSSFQSAKIYGCTAQPRFVALDSNGEGPTSSSTNSLINGMLSRVERTLYYKSMFIAPSIQQSKQVNGTIDEIISSVREIGSDCTFERTEVDPNRIDSLVNSMMSRGLQTLSSNTMLNDDLSASNPIDYNSNPTITTTALAHSLWSYVLRPGFDSAIDATAGNGGDSLTIARMLFPSYIAPVTVEDTLEESEFSIDTKSQLIAIDIQESACHNTTERLSAVLPRSLLRNNVQVHRSNHETMITPNDTTSIALIVYNLGFLPGSSTKDSVTTSTTTTIASLANAACLLRNGGMLSVTTYPRTGRDEDAAVRAFMEGLALFSSKTQSWSDYIQNIEFDKIPSMQHNVYVQLEESLRHVHENDPKKKWRVTEHKKLGRLDAPILFTAVRIM